ncbi:MAG: hypothetical protein QNJ46_27475 [Leptolyngbyaceae cyanobacterium MO_188.B28]|nr:hypothetical protein [Leptolyngbyaceae cyanobacterium MO_188.B28]
MGRFVIVAYTPKAGKAVRSHIDVGWLDARRPSIFAVQNCHSFSCLCDRCLTIRLHPMKREVLVRIEKPSDTGKLGH